MIKVKNFFLISSWDFPPSTRFSLPVNLLLCTSEKRASVFSVSSEQGVVDSNEVSP